MFGKTVVRDMISRSAENETDRRLFMKSAGVAGLGVVGGAALTSVGIDPASASASASAAAPSDGAILNFALNLEYLEAEFYSYAAFGHGLPHALTTGKGRHGGVIGGHAVHFTSRKTKWMAHEIAHDEVNHVKFLRTALGAAKVSRPEIDLKHSFTAAAQAAGLIGAHQTFDPFANENNFLLAAFIFEDVGVTAYKGAAPLISNKGYLDAAAGILAVEAYHAGLIRGSLYERSLGKLVNAISAARDSLDGHSNDDKGLYNKHGLTLIPTDKNSIAFGRSADRVLNVVYLNPKKVSKGGFYPHGVNGAISVSGGK